jgi:predicted nucleotidyltransferase
MSGSSPLLPVVQRIVHERRNEIRERYGVQKIGVFGSVSRQEESWDSDIDILIDFIPGQAKYRCFIDLAELLESLFDRRVDLITVNGLSPYMRPAIEREVIWIYQ